jgi:hypothetical protein
MPAALLLATLLLAPPVPVAPAAGAPAGIAYFDLRNAADAAFADQRWAAAESLYARIAAAGDDGGVWFRLGQSQVRQRRWAEAARTFQRAVPFGTRRSVEGSVPFMEYRVARCFALAGERDSALAWLARSLADGLDDRGDVAEDASFESLRGDARFDSLAGRLRGDPGRDAGWRHDLDHLVSEIRRVHARYRREPLPPGFEAEVAALDRDVPASTDAQVFARMQRLLVRLGDGHSVLYPFGERLAFPALPVRLYHFADGWFVVQAPDSQRAWVGRRVVAIGGVPMDTIAARLEAWVSRDNAVGIDWIGPVYLQLGDVLAAIGATRDPRRVTFTLERPRGRPETVTVREGPPLAPNAPKLRAPAGIAAPLWQRAIERPFWLAELPAPRALYLQFNQVADADSERLEDFAVRLRGLLARDSIKDLVVDVRHNNGGNGYLLGELHRTLVWFTAAAPAHRLFVLMGRNTFSAAQSFLNRLEHDTPAILVGEPSSSHPDFAGEDTALRLPWSGVRGSISSRFHMVDGADTRVWIAPDLPVRLTSADWLGGRDPALDAVLEVIRR